MGNELDDDVILRFEAVDADFVREFQAEFPELEISGSKRFVGGSDVLAAFRYSKDILGKVLKFLSSREARIKKPTLKIGKTGVEFKDMPVDQMMELMAAPGFEATLKTVTGKK